MSTNSPKSPEEIVDSMLLDIGNDVLNSDLSEYSSGANNSAENWTCDNYELLYAGWDGRGKIKFTAIIHCVGEYQQNKSIFGPNKISQKIEGALVDPDGSYQFKLENVECLE
jgi:hypothetical protein